MKKFAVMTMIFFLILAFQSNVSEAKKAKAHCQKAKRVGNSIRHGNKFEIPKIDGNVKEGDIIPVRITGYYGPLPGQKRYARGSFAADRALNGKGEKTSSGVKPAPGMAAADPKILPQGSIVSIPDFGLITITDKGRDIKGQKIDIFTGHGEDALKKALKINHIMEITVVYLAEKKQDG